MTTIFNAPEEFATTALSGFANIYKRYVRHVRGGVVRSTKSPKGKVVLVIGGGSGHYPAFAGYVGAGLADAAVAGDIFASPSTASVARVCRQAHKGGGILLGFGNYAGDVLNFGVAAERLRSEGIDVRILPVSDDVASSGIDQKNKRRGIAGDLVVFKIAGAAADAGHSIDEVERIARHANHQTASFGVAFSGCTLPGADHPLFIVAEGQMALGLGIHGEPGIAEQKIVSATELAALLVEKLLKECPKNIRKVGAILNGLGATKYEELFVLWTEVAKLLNKADMEIIEPEVGEFVTSLDMQGCSLTLVWLDDELEKYWCAPCASPVLHRGIIISEPETEFVPDEDLHFNVVPTNNEGKQGGKCVQRILTIVAKALSDSEEELGRIDAFAGDGDHGQGMRRGSEAAKEVADIIQSSGAGGATVLALAGDAWADRAGGTSGAIWGLLLRSWSNAFRDDEKPSGAAIIEGARRALDAVMALGGAKLNDKTLVDAFIPFVETLETAFAKNQNIQLAWQEAAEAAQKAADATASLTPRLGRARPLAEKSIGHPDAGAISLALVAKVVGIELQKC